jgi:hypothetical protein
LLVENVSAFATKYQGKTVRMVACVVETNKRKLCTRCKGKNNCDLFNKNLVIGSADYRFDDIELGDELSLVSERFNKHKARLLERRR